MVVLKNIVVSVSMSVLASTAFAQEYPAKDVTLIVPWSAGGGTDTIARSLVADAQECFGENINVVNKTGAVGAVGMGAVTTARNDGYTVGLITFNLSTYGPLGQADLSYRDYDLIQLINQSPGALSVAADSEFETLDDLMTYSKENPGVVTMGHSGTGGAWHLSAALLAAEHEASFNYVPFDGSANVRTALLGKHVAVAATGIDEMKQLLEAGEVRILAVNARERADAFPDVPTVAEAGYALEAPIYDWRGLAAPKGLDPEVKTAIVKGFKACFESDAFQSLAKERGLPLTYKDPAEFETFLAELETGLAAVISDLGLGK
ncbi:Bug family tripartite tricarboxylate transporter substrate binding protein [Celeribacter sp.]|uniref:Bug family tripartite tricarboxylate transporter substrate binding protein n=1 Tax=Celeribacter sp. TaxID=1890673 RepID=UPI003A949750